MTYLLDTHTALWWWTEPERLSKTAYQLISEQDNVIYISSASIWEMATKHRKGNLGEAYQVLENFDKLMTINHFLHLPISWRHAKRAGSYQQSHKDPFDRILVAQAELNQLTLLSVDKALHDFPAKVVW